jgi:sensor domain CHASE-containing protein
MARGDQAQNSRQKFNSNFFMQRAALGTASTAQAAWDQVGTHTTLPDDNWTQ